MVSLLLVAFSSPTHAAAWQGEIWSSSGDAPDLAVDPSTGDVHLAWLDGGSANHAVFDRDGALVETHREDAWGGEGDGWTFGPGVAVGPGSTVYLSFKSGEGGWVYTTRLAVRTGGSWRAPIDLQQSAERGYGSQVAADGQGATVVVERADSTPYGAMSQWSVEAGSLVASGDITDARVDDRVDITAGEDDGERHAFAGYPNPGGHIYYSNTHDGGLSWSGAEAIESGTCSAGRNGQPDAATDEDGRVHLVYGCSVDTQVGGPSLRHALIDDHEVVEDRVVTSDLEEWHLSLGIGRVAVVGSEDVVVAYLTHDSGALHAVHSSDSGASWSAPEWLASEGGDSEGRNAPALVASGNVLFLAWSEAGAVHVARGVVEGADEEEPEDSGDEEGSGGDGGDSGAEDVTEDTGGSDKPDRLPREFPEESVDEGGCTTAPAALGVAWLALLVALGRRRRTPGVAGAE